MKFTVKYKGRNRTIDFGDVPIPMPVQSALKFRGVGTGAIRQLKAAGIVEKLDWTDGLGVRVLNCLNNVNCKTKEQAIDLVKSGALKRYRDFGYASLKELCRHLSLPDPEYFQKKTHPDY